MKKQLLILMTIAACVAAAPAFGQTATSQDVSDLEATYRFFVGSSLFMLYNYVPDERPGNYVQLDFGYHLTPKDVIYAEAITWTYWEPLGTYGDSKELYPGSVTAYGVGLAYQRFLWRGLYYAAQATPFYQVFYDRDHESIQSGFQLYLQTGFGYRIEFAKKRLFVEPAWYIKYWPVNTNIPEEFAEIDRGTPDYKFEPGLNFGYRF